MGTPPFTAGTGSFELPGALNYCPAFGSIPHPLSPAVQFVSVGAMEGPLQHPTIAMLFDDSYLKPLKGISDTSFKLAAIDLNTEVEVIQAVEKKELGDREAFEERGRPIILFEPHIFQDRTSNRYNNTNSYVSNSGEGSGYYSEQYKKLKQAYALAPNLALQSASWGAFQIMGFNFNAAGYSSVEEMVMDLMTSEEAHLKAAVKFIKSDTVLHDAFKTKNWQVLAYKYNGENYKSHNYDTDLEKLYGQLKSAKKMIKIPTLNIEVPADATENVCRMP